MQEVYLKDLWKAHLAELDWSDFTQVESKTHGVALSEHFQIRSFVMISITRFFDVKS